MPTGPNKINVERITHVSNDELSDSTNELLTASAIQRIMKMARGTMPLIQEFTDVDLVAGILSIPYTSDVDAIYVVVVDDTGTEIKVPVNYNRSTKIVSINLTSIAGTIVSPWTIAIWTATGPKQPYPENLVIGAYDSSINFLRVRINDGDPVDFKVANDISFYTVPTGYALVIEELNIAGVDISAVDTQPTFLLEVLGGWNLIAAETSVNITPAELYRNFNLRDIPRTVIPSDAVLRFVSVAATGGTNYTASVDISGYLIPWFVPSSSSSSTSSSSSSSSSTSSSSSSSSTSSSSSSSSSTSSSSSSSSTSSSSSSSSSSSTSSSSSSSSSTSSSSSSSSSSTSSSSSSSSSTSSSSSSSSTSSSSSSSSSTSSSSSSSSSIGCDTTLYDEYYANLTYYTTAANSGGTCGDPTTYTDIFTNVLLSKIDPSTWYYSADNLTIYLYRQVDEYQLNVSYYGRDFNLGTNARKSLLCDSPVGAYTPDECNCGNGPLPWLTYCCRVDNVSITNV